MAVKQTQPRRTQAILDIVRACDAVQLATVRPDGMPETRDMANMMNRDATDLALYFMTSRHSPKAAQLTQNPNCCLYYYNHENHHSVRLFGTMTLIDDVKSRHAHWNEEFRKFGYDGPDDAEFVLLRFNPAEYKYYDADGIQTGRLD